MHHEMMSSIVTASELQRLINDPEDSEFGEYLQTCNGSIQDLIMLNTCELEEDGSVIHDEEDAPTKYQNDQNNKSLNIKHFQHQNLPSNIENNQQSSRKSQQYDQESIFTNIIIQDDSRQYQQQCVQKVPQLTTSIEKGEFEISGGELQWR